MLSVYGVIEDINVQGVDIVRCRKGLNRIGCCGNEVETGLEFEMDSRSFVKGNGEVGIINESVRDSAKKQRNKGG